MFILISNNKKFTKIINKKEYKEELIPEMQKSNCMVWQSNSETCPYKVGDDIPFSSQFDIHLIKRLGKIKYRKYKKLKKQKKEVEFSLVKKYFNNLTQEKIDNCKAILESSKKDDEVFYRIFYNSFKMYRLRNQCFILTQALKHLCENDYLEFDEKKYKNTLNLKWFDQTLKLSLEEVLKSQFTLHQNESTEWAKDARNMVGTYQMLVQALDYVIRFSEDVLNKKGFIFENKGFIDWHEAGTMEIYLPLRNFRGMSNEAMKKYLKIESEVPDLNK